MSLDLSADLNRVLKEDLQIKQYQELKSEVVGHCLKNNHNGKITGRTI